MKNLKIIIEWLVSFPSKIRGKISIFSLVKNSVISKSSAVGRNCRIYDSLIEENSYVGNNTIVINTKIGKYCSISYDCIINPGNHPLNLLSTSPMFYTKKNILRQNFDEVEFEEYPTIEIGNDVLVGTRSIILGGVKIGDGAVIGAGSIVTKDVEPYTIVAGNPAKKIRGRFDGDIEEKLVSIKWWDKSPQTITRIAQEFRITKK